MGDIHWSLWLLGVAGGGAIIKVLADWLARVLKGDTEKGIDTTALATAISDALNVTLTTVSGQYITIIEKLNVENERLDRRVSLLELKVEDLIIEVDEYRIITSSTHRCALLKDNPEFKCPVVLGMDAKANKEYKKITSDE